MVVIRDFYLKNKLGHILNFVLKYYRMQHINNKYGAFTIAKGKESENRYYLVHFEQLTTNFYNKVIDM